MKGHDSEDPETRLRALLLEARPVCPLPKGFEAAVWRQLRGSDEPGWAQSVGAWLERLTTRLLEPRRAAVGLALVLLAGTVLGIRDGRDRAREGALARYVSSVSPLAPPR